MFEKLPKTSNEFYTVILMETLVALKTRNLEGNFDATRFNLPGQDLSRTFKAAEHTFYFDWFFRVSDQLFKVYDLFKIPLWTHREFPFYRFRIGHYTIHLEETVLYAYDPGA